MFYLIRHAESVANTQGVYQGVSFNTPLSALGRLQAQALGRRALGWPFTRVITSPLSRTLETARFLTLTRRTSPIIDLDLIETNHGLWEGLPKSAISTRWPDMYQTWQLYPSQAVFPQGEAFLETQRRVLSWWRKAQFLAGHTAVVTHDNIIRIILAHLTQTHLDRMWEFPVHPAAVTVVEVTPHFSQIKKISDIEHLHSLRSDLSAHAL